MRRLTQSSVMVAGLLVCTFLSGCGTVLTLSDSDREGTRHGLIYSGVRFDCRGAFDDDYMQHFPLGKLLCVVDIPLSLLSDTIVLPVTAVVEYKRSRRRDEGLYGTWKSDRDRTLQEYHRIYDRYNLSREWTDKNIGGYGKRTITFSKTNMVVEIDGAKKAYPYRVVSGDTNSVEILWRPRDNNEFLEIAYDKDGFWYMPQSAACREYYRREKLPNKPSGGDVLKAALEE